MHQKGTNESSGRYTISGDYAQLVDMESISGKFRNKKKWAIKMSYNVRNCKPITVSKDL